MLEYNLTLLKMGLDTADNVSSLEALFLLNISQNNAPNVMNAYFRENDAEHQALNTFLNELMALQANSGSTPMRVQLLLKLDDMHYVTIDFKITAKRIECLLLDAVNYRNIDLIIRALQQHPTNMLVYIASGETAEEHPQQSSRSCFTHAFDHLLKISSTDPYAELAQRAIVRPLLRKSHHPQRETIMVKTIYWHDLPIEFLLLCESNDLAENYIKWNKDLATLAHFQKVYEHNRTQSKGLPFMGAASKQRGNELLAFGKQVLVQANKEQLTMLLSNRSLATNELATHPNTEYCWPSTRPYHTLDHAIQDLTSVIPTITTNADLNKFSASADAALNTPPFFTLPGREQLFFRKRVEKLKGLAKGNLESLEAEQDHIPPKTPGADPNPNK